MYGSLGPDYPVYFSRYTNYTVVALVVICILNMGLHVLSIIEAIIYSTADCNTVYLVINGVIMTFIILFLIYELLKCWGSISLNDDFVFNPLINRYYVRSIRTRLVLFLYCLATVTFTIAPAIMHNRGLGPFAESCDYFIKTFSLFNFFVPLIIFVFNLIITSLFITCTEQNKI